MRRGSEGCLDGKVGGVGWERQCEWTLGSICALTQRIICVASGGVLLLFLMHKCREKIVERGPDRTAIVQYSEPRSETAGDNFELGLKPSEKWFKLKQLQNNQKLD